MRRGEGQQTPSDPQRRKRAILVGSSPASVRPSVRPHLAHANLLLEEEFVLHSSVSTFDGKRELAFSDVNEFTRIHYRRGPMGLEHRIL
jgi:hypothetical protein